MAEHSGRHRVAASARGAHRCAKLDIHQLAHRELLSVVPSAVVEPLADDLDRRLRAVLLEHRHVEVIDKHHRAGSLLWTKDSFFALVELVVDDVLNLVGVCLRAERALDVGPLVLVHRIERLLDVHRLTGTGGTSEEHVFAVSGEDVENVSVPNGVDGRDHDVLKFEFLANGLVLDRFQPVGPTEFVLLEVHVVHAALGGLGESLGDSFFSWRNNFETGTEVKIRPLGRRINLTVDELAQEKVELLAALVLGGAADGPHDRKEEDAVDEYLLILWCHDLVKVLAIRQFNPELVNH